MSANALSFTPLLLLGFALSALSSCRDASEPAAGRVMWSISAPGGISPAFDDRSAFFLTSEHEVVAVDKESGRVRWRKYTDAGGPLEGRNIVVAGDAVVVPDVSLYAFHRETGERLWVFQPSTGDRPGFQLIATDGSTIYAGGQTARVYAVSAETGEARWTASIDETTGITTAFNPSVFDGVVYVGLKRFDVPATGALVAIDAVTGEERWRRPFVPEVETQPAGCLGGAIAEGNSVFVSADDGRVYSLAAANGAVEWVAPRVTTPSDETSTLAGDLRPVTLAHGLLIAGSQATGILTAYDPETGEDQWQASANRGGTRYPLSSGDGALYVLHLGGQLAAMEGSSGALLWRAGDPQTRLEPFVASPAVDDDRLYIPGQRSAMALAR